MIALRHKSEWMSTVCSLYRYNSQELYRVAQKKLQWAQSIMRFKIFYNLFFWLFSLSPSCKDCTASLITPPIVTSLIENEAIARRQSRDPDFAINRMDCQADL